MVQFEFLDGKKAGSTWVARRFPVRVGRGADADLQLEEAGVWEEHAEIGFDRAEGFVLRPRGDALVAVNGQRIERAVLRNGDAIEMGAVKLQFWLGQTRQAGLRMREWLTWTGIGLLSLGQAGLIYWLLR